MHRVISSCLLICAFALVLNASSDSAHDIRKVLDEQVAAWNRGDLKGFMRGYWHSPDLTFYSGQTVTKGWDETLARYRKRYQGEGAQMGKLTFSDLDVQMLARDAAWVGGHWQLEMREGKKMGGIFTLIVRKLPDGWRIVHDHTS